MFDLSADVIEKFNIFASLLLEKNAYINLTAIRDKKGIAIKHFADSLYGSEHIPSGSYVADIGSGAGFPALALAIARPDINVVLMESIGKKVDFLNSVISETQTPNAKACQIRAEKASHGKYREMFDIVTARGVAGLNVLVEYAIPLLKKDGLFLAYKGEHALQEIKDSSTALQALNADVISSNQFLLDNTHIRYIVAIKKLSLTDKKYPRSNKKIKSSPL